MLRKTCMACRKPLGAVCVAVDEIGFEDDGDPYLRVVLTDTEAVGANTRVVCVPRTRMAFNALILKVQERFSADETVFLESDCEARFHPRKGDAAPRWVAAVRTTESEPDET